MCPVCRRSITVTAAGLVRVHGPVSARCAGSREVPCADPCPATDVDVDIVASHVVAAVDGSDGRRGEGAVDGSDGGSGAMGLMVGDGSGGGRGEGAVDGSVGGREDGTVDGSDGGRGDNAVYGFTGEGGDGADGGSAGKCECGGRTDNVVSAGEGDGGGGAVVGTAGEGGGGAVVGSAREGQGGGGAVAGSTGECGSGVVVGSTSTSQPATTTTRALCTHQHVSTSSRTYTHASQVDAGLQDCSTSMGTDATFEVSRVCTVVQATTNHQLGNRLPNMDDILTEYRPATIANFSWSGIGADAFTSDLDRAYSEVCGWKRNIFTLPSGGSSKAFVAETARLLSAFATHSALESVALKACMVMPALILQKPHKNSKSHENLKCVTRRMELWKSGDISALLHECRAIQRLLSKPSKRSAQPEDDAACRGFTRQMLLGNVKGALRCLSQSTKGGVLPLTADCGDGKTTLEALRDKHPAASPIPDGDVLLHGPIEVMDPVIFERMDAKFMRTIALDLTGAAGVSGLDSSAWRRMCCSFGGASSTLCAAIAATARRVATEYVDPSTISPLLSGRLIPLDKNPGVRPIGIGEVLRRFLAKAVIRVVRSDIQAAAGCLQVCAGHESGAEAAIHAMSGFFKEEECHGILLVDATNAFNALNRRVMLRNVQVLCPSVSVIVINFYRQPASLYVHGEIIQSLEGTTQGDPLAMPVYAIAVTPIISALAIAHRTVCQIWYADDSAAGGLLPGVRQWWQSLCDLGPLYGYHPNASKTWLVVKPQHLAVACKIFAGTGVQITDTGRPYLGAAIGAEEFQRAYMADKVDTWCEELHMLALFATSDPQSALAAFSHVLCHKWTYWMRTMSSDMVDFSRLEDIIVQEFLPCITGMPPLSQKNRLLLSLPTRLGGLGVSCPSSVAPLQRATSMAVSSQLQHAILQQSQLLDLDTEFIQAAKLEGRAALRALWSNTTATVTESLNARELRVLEANCDRGASAWLSCLPIAAHGFSLDRRSFQDALAARYSWPVQGLPDTCLCGAAFTVDHGMICRRGGFPIIRHNHVRDYFAALLAKVCNAVETEPLLQPLAGETLPAAANTDREARVDVKGRGLWSMHEDAFFDIRVFYPCASSYMAKSLPATYRWHEEQKKAAYGERIRQVERGYFSPLVFSSVGGAGGEAKNVLKRVVSRIASAAGEPYSICMGRVRCELGFSLVRDSVMMLRGSRRKMVFSHHPSDLLQHESRMQV